MSNQRTDNGLKISIADTGDRNIIETIRKYTDKINQGAEIE